MKRSTNKENKLSESKAARLQDVTAAESSDEPGEMVVLEISQGDVIDQQPAVITVQPNDSDVVIENTEYIEEITDTAEAAPVEMSLQTEDMENDTHDSIRIIKVLPTTITSAEKPVYQQDNTRTKQRFNRFPVSMGNTSKSQKVARPAGMKSSSLLSLMASVAAQSAIANAALKSSDNKPAPLSEPTVNEAWHERLKAVPFSAIIEEEVVTWINNNETSMKPDIDSSHWMLNPSRKVCVFVNFNTDNKGKRIPQYLCNYCKLTETSYSGILQHLNHHIFVCGTCPYYSSTRFDIELHRQRVGHMQPLSDGYIVHKQGTSMCAQKLRSNIKLTRSPVASLLEWMPIQEETESLIIMDSQKPPESARRAFFQKNPLATTSEIAALNMSTSVVCALPYYRYVAGKSNRKHVLEFHCNFCQSTPAFTQELYRHIDFHALDCPADDCEFRCFTRLELHLHQRQEHEKQAKDFLDDLVVLVPLMSIPEESLVENASMCHAKWSVILKLPNITEIPGSGDFCSFRHTSKECEYRCTICNLFVINKGGMSSHLKMHDVQAKDFDRYMEPV